MRLCEEHDNRGRQAKSTGNNNPILSCTITENEDSLHLDARVLAQGITPGIRRLELTARDNASRGEVISCAGGEAKSQREEG